jgi:hypothetical protein
LESNLRFIEGHPMIILTRLCISIVISILLTACVIGNGQICGPQTPMAYCDKVALESLLHPKSLIDDWGKAGVISEGKVHDWIACGGSRDGNYAASVSDFDQIQRCMLQKGYLYTGKCDNEIMKATPGCRVPQH